MQTAKAKFSNVVLNMIMSKKTLPIQLFLIQTEFFIIDSDIICLVWKSPLGVQVRLAIAWKSWRRADLSNLQLFKRNCRVATESGLSMKTFLRPWSSIRSSHVHLYMCAYSMKSGSNPKRCVIEFVIWSWFVLTPLISFGIIYYDLQ